MPIKKFKTFEEAEKEQWNFQPDEDYFKRIRLLFRLAHRLNPTVCSRGIYKFRTIQEANKHRYDQQLKHAVRKIDSIQKGL